MVHIFLLAGQSNMAGAGNTAELPAVQRTPPDNVRLFEDGAWRDLLWRDRFGPEVGFSQVMSPVMRKDQIALCKVARGGANLYYDWNPDGTSQGPEDDYRGPLYPQLTAAMDALRKQFTATGEPWVFSGLLWMQGERDAVFEFMARSYERNLNAFIASIRRGVGDDELPVIIGQIAPRIYRLEEGRFQHAFRTGVQHAQRQVARADDFVRLVETMDLPQSDNLHFNTGGQLELGRRFAQAWLQVNDVTA